MPLSLAHYSRVLPIIAGVVLIFLFLHLRSTGFGTQSSPVIVEPEVNSPILNQTIPVNKVEPEPEPEIPTPAPEPCHPLPGMEDILVILKTGVTESHERVPIQFNTTLRCIPNLLIVSDFEETINGVRTHDVFRNMSESVRENKDFELYNRARENGIDGLTAQDMRKVANSAAGMSDNPGWKLDKWKFLPMAVEARNYKADAKWYVVLEADTYLIWPNLLGLLAHHDPAKKLYIGNQMQIGADIFAHGGSGFVLSNSAINAVADEYTSKEEEWHVRTNANWAGDCILGQLLTGIGIPLTWSSPHVSGNSLWEQNAFAAWCVPPVSFHHMTPDDIEFVYEFDSDWHANRTVTDSYLLYSDVFYYLISPNIADAQPNWDNNAGTIMKKEGDENAKWTGFECAEACAKNANCLQYRIDGSGVCKTSDSGFGGQASAGVTSGSMMWRVDEKVRALGQCEGPKWVGVP